MIISERKRARERESGEEFVPVFLFFCSVRVDDPATLFVICFDTFQSQVAGTDSDGYFGH